MFVFGRRKPKRPSVDVFDSRSSVTTRVYARVVPEILRSNPFAGALLTDRAQGTAFLNSFRGGGVHHLRLELYVDKHAAIPGVRLTYGHPDVDSVMQSLDSPVYWNVRPQPGATVEHEGFSGDRPRRLVFRNVVLEIIGRDREVHYRGTIPVLHFSGRNHGRVVVRFTEPPE